MHFIVERKTSELHKINERLKKELKANKELEKALNQTRDQLQSLMDNTTVVIYMKDREGRYILINRQGEADLEMDKENIVGKTDYDLFPKNLAEEFRKNDLKVNETGRPVEFEETRTFPSGTTSYLSVKFPVFDHAGEVWAVGGISTDITGRKKSEEELRDSEEKLRALINASTEPALLIDTRGRILALNKTSARYYGRSMNELVGSNGYSFMPPSVAKSRKAKVWKAIRSGKPVRFEDEHNGKTFDNNIYPVLDVKGIGKATAVYSQDITLEKQMMNDLQKSEEKYRKLFDYVPVGVGLSTPDGKLLECNEAMCKTTGYSPGDFTQITAADLYESPEDRMRVLKHLQEDGLVRNYENTMKRKDGTTYLARLTVVPLTLDDDLLLTVNKDITNQRAAEEAAEESRHRLEQQVKERTAELEVVNEQLSEEVLKRGKVGSNLERMNKKLTKLNKRLSKEYEERKLLSRKLIDLLERDRRDISMELHDQLGQTLSTLKMDLEMIARSPEAAEVTFKEKIKTAIDTAGNAIRDVKDISCGLRPSLLDNLGLVPALHELLDDIERRFDLRIEFFCHSVPVSGVFGAERDLALYRICQEAMTNVIKYARATEVFVNLVKKNSTIALTVEDNGVGFEPKEAMNVSRGKGPLGLIIMRERAVQLGGEFFVESRFDSGTHILVAIPV